MSFYLKSGNVFRVTSKEAMDLSEMLPAGNYIVKVDMHGNFFLETVDAFEFGSKLYGNTIRHTDRILQTFLDRPASTGVMLTGEKGSGKTLLAKNIAINAAKQGIPTLIINSPFHGDSFNAFIQSIEQPAIIMFDEFEKVYDEEKQQAILTLLDGVFPSKKLFMLTCNDKWRVDKHMRNRPGRIYYMLDFKGLDSAFIREYCEDNLKAKEYIENICRIASMFDQFNFDMIKALVEEMNRFGETPQECLQLLNAKPEFAGRSDYEVQLQINGLDIPDDNIHDKILTLNPMQQAFNVDFDTGTVDDDNDEIYASAMFSAADLKQIEPSQNKFVFINNQGQRVTLNKVQEKTVSYSDLY